MRSVPTAAPGLSRLAARARALSALLAFAAGGAGGCGADVPTGVPGVPGAMAYPALAAYAFWWSLVEQCSGLRGDFAAMRWASVAGAALPGTGGEFDGVQGQWDPASNTITVVSRDTAAGPLIRHEMLHALLGPGYAGARPHPAAYFGVRCGGTVICEGRCAAEVAIDTFAPADAPAVRPGDLAVSAQVVVPPAGTAAAGGAFAIVVTARNPTGVAGWVPRSANANAPETPDFGYTLTMPLFPNFPLGSLHAAPGARTYFATGETRHFVFDVHAGDLLPGAYTLQGSFAGAMSAPTAITLPP